jgi:hypothetical protein
VCKEKDGHLEKSDWTPTQWVFQSFVAISKAKIGFDLMVYCSNNAAAAQKNFCIKASAFIESILGFL